MRESYPQMKEAMNLMYYLTSAKNIIWEPDELEPCDMFVARIGNKPYRIQFYYPERTTSGADRDIVEVTFGGTVFTFFNGTEGFALVIDMLALNIPERGDWSLRCQNRVEENIKELKTLLEEGVS
jgi:hypothetical protein